MQTITPTELKAWLLTEDDTEELALIDVRGQGAFSASHLLFAVSIPLSRLELMIGAVIPRRSTRIVVVDDPAQEALSERAAQRLDELGYGDVWVLDGGISRWQTEGFELFSGVNVPSKAFGEFVEHTFDTPRLSADEVKAMLDSGRDMVIVDSRPFTEYHRMNIPTATDMPGAELAYRIHDFAPDPDTFVVVNCAGRTRSIIGTQSLINAGIPNPVAALKDGTMGWHLAGFELENGSTREAPAPSAMGIEKAKAAAARVADRFEVPKVDAEAVAAWRRDDNRTTFLLDVRSPAEYAAGHLEGFRHAPGGQLVQATDEYVAVRNARIVLADDVEVRATMTASWLIQMGWRNVYVLAGGISADAELVTDAPDTHLGEPTAATVSVDELARDRDSIAVIDIGLSNAYERVHIPGAIWCVRTRLQPVLATQQRSRVVLTADDPVLVELALAEARSLTTTPVDALIGGNPAWVAAGQPTESGLTHIEGDTDDVWYKPYEHREAQEKFMQDYLTWEVALVEQLERDGTTRFRTL